MSQRERHYSHEFQVNTGSDFEDLMDIFETNDQNGRGIDTEGLPGLLTVKAGVV